MMRIGARSSITENWCLPNFQIPLHIYSCILCTGPIWSLSDCLRFDLTVSNVLTCSRHILSFVVGLPPCPLADKFMITFLHDILFTERKLIALGWGCMQTLPPTLRAWLLEVNATLPYKNLTYAHRGGHPNTITFGTTSCNIEEHTKEQGEELLPMSFQALSHIIFPLN